MNTILILTAKSRAAEVLRDKKTLKRARALNRAGRRHFENAGDTAARLIGGTRVVRTPAQLNREMETARKHDLRP